jgi:hypothetical protein
MSDSEQELLSRVMALDAAPRKCLVKLSVLCGSEAQVRLRTMRDELIHEFKERRARSHGLLADAALRRVAAHALNVKTRRSAGSCRSKLKLFS